MLFFCVKGVIMGTHTPLWMLGGVEGASRAGRVSLSTERISERKLKGNEGCSTFGSLHLIDDILESLAKDFRCGFIFHARDVGIRSFGILFQKKVCCSLSCVSLNIEHLNREWLHSKLQITSYLDPVGFEIDCFVCISQCVFIIFQRRISS